MAKKAEAERVRRIARGLEILYPEASCSLRFRNAFELLVATILSAQCTDERVNRVTPEFFRLWPGPAELADAEASEVEALVRSTGFFRNKARFLKDAARQIMEKHGGRVPRAMADLVELPGVARKTANVVLGTAMGLQEGFVVDTHVSRLAGRLGLSSRGTPEGIERDLMALFPRREWTALGHRLICHGRTTCVARRPKCGECALRADCPRTGLGGEDAPRLPSAGKPRESAGR
jgi:endonuclease-3